MADYSCCPNSSCGRKAKNNLSSNHFPVYKCRDCSKLYCKVCGGNSCPACGSSKSSTVGKVYAK